MAGLYFSVGADFQKLQQLKKDLDDLKAKLKGMDSAADKKAFDALNRQLQQVQREYDTLAGKISRYVTEQNKASQATASSTNEMLNLFAKIGGTTAFIGLGKQVMDVRNEFQQLEIAFGTMLKSTDKEAALMKDLSKFAAETPFGLQSAASGAKQLLAYGSTADTVIKELTMLGDVAAGTGQQIGDLVYLYGTLRTQGRAYLMDIRQFAGRGIPIYDELAKVLNTSKDKVNELVSAGKVGFPEVERAFKNMTTQGGLYGGLMEQQSAAIGGRLEALKDNIDSIFNTIGKNNEGVIYKSIDGLNTLVENYDKVGKILVALVATYGTYRAALIATTAIQNIGNIQAYASAFIQTARSLGIATAAQTAFNVSVKANPYVLLATTVVGLAVAVWALHDSTTAQEKAQERLNKRNEEAAKRKEDLQNETTRLIGVINSETASILQQVQAWDKLKEQYPEWVKNMSMAEFKALSLTEQQKLLNEALDSKTIKDTNAELQSQQKMVDELKTKIKEINIQENYTNTEAVKRLELLKDQLKKEDLHLEGLKKINKELEIQRLQAEFQAKPENKRRDILQEQLDDLKRQKSILEDNITKSGGLENAAMKVSPQFKMWGVQLQGVQNLIDQVKNSIDALDPNKKPKDKSFWKKQKEDAEAVLDAFESSQLSLLKRGVTKGIDPKVVDSYKKATKDISEANKNLGVYDFSGKSDKKAQEAADKMREASLKLLNLQAELDNESVKQQLDHEQQLLDIEQDSFDKRYRQNQLNTAKEFLSVEDYRQKMAKAQQDAAKDIYIKKNGNDTGFNFTTFDKTLLPDGLRSDSVEAQANKMVEAITSAYKKGNEDIARDKQAFLNEENMIFASELDKQLDSIRTHYEQRRKEAGTDAELLKKINENEIKETSSARLQSRQKRLEADSDYNQKYIQLVTDRYAFEADKRKVALQQQIKDQEAIISNLSDQLLNDPNNDELANQLRAARLELKQFNKELDNTTADKFLEIANGVSGVASSLRSALDDFGISFSENANKVADGAMQILEGGSKIAEGAKNMDISGMIQGAITQTQGYFNIIGGLFGPNGTAEYEGIKSQLESINKIYESIIANSKEDIVFGGGFATINAASTALDNYNKKVINLQKIAAASGGAGAAWNSHSAAWHTNKNVGADNFMSMGKIIDKSVNSINDLYNLTGDELYLIQSQMPEAWDKIDGRIKENLQSIIDCKDEANELKDALNEALTGVSQDAFYNDFINNLSDMSMSWEDMCDDFEDSLRKSIIAGLVADQYRDRINALYQSWSDAAKSDGRITEDEAKKLKEEYKSIVEQMMKDRESLVDSFGWDTSSGSSQSSSRGGFETITQDQAGSIDGRLTGIHETDIQNGITLKSIESNVAKIAQWNQPIGEKFNIDGIAVPILALNESALRVERMIEENRSIAIQMFYKVSDIEKHTKELYEINEGIKSIRKNTDVFNKK